MPTPQDYARDYDQLRARMARAVPPPGADLDAAQARATCAEVVRFVRRWEGRFPHAEFKDALQSLRDWGEALRLQIEKERQLHLSELFAARNEGSITRMLFDFGLALIKTMKETPPEQRPALEAIYREEMGQPFVPETEYRQTEALLDQSEARFKRRWDKFKAAFPEAATEALHQRLLNASAEDLQAWAAELTAPPTPPTAQ